MRVSAPRSFAWNVRVYWEDTDAAGFVYYANYLRFLERARTEWLRAVGFEQEDLARRLGVAFVVRSMTIEYLRPARLDDALEVTARLRGVGAGTIEFAQSVSRGGERLVEAVVKVACVRITAARPARIPVELRAVLVPLISDPAAAGDP